SAIADSLKLAIPARCRQPDFGFDIGVAARRQRRGQAAECRQAPEWVRRPAASAAASVRRTATGASRGLFRAACTARRTAAAARLNKCACRNHLSGIDGGIRKRQTRQVLAGRGRREAGCSKQHDGQENSRAYTPKMQQGSTVENRCPLIHSASEFADKHTLTRTGELHRLVS